MTSPSAHALCSFDENIEWDGTRDVYSSYGTQHDDGPRRSCGCAGLSYDTAYCRSYILRSASGAEQQSSSSSSCQSSSSPPGSSPPRTARELSVDGDLELVGGVVVILAVLGCLVQSVPDPNHPVAGVLVTGQAGRMSGRKRCCCNPRVVLLLVTEYQPQRVSKAVRSS